VDQAIRCACSNRIDGIPSSSRVYKRARVYVSVIVHVALRCFRAGVAVRSVRITCIDTHVHTHTHTHTHTSTDIHIKQYIHAQGTLKKRCAVIDSLLSLIIANGCTCQTRDCAADMPHAQAHAWTRMRTRVISIYSDNGQTGTRAQCLRTCAMAPM